MLKSTPNGIRSLRPQSATRQPLLDTAYQVSSNSMPTSKIPENPASPDGKWQAYTNGGAATDDAKFLQKIKQEQAAYLETIHNIPPAAVGSSKATKLVEISPEKKAVSKNTNLLIDLDFGAEPEIHHQQSYANVISSGKGRVKARMSKSFLD
jgi:helicase required for RNAi-mediated heterochromatin assembly 1